MAIKYPLSLVVQATDKATGTLRRINADIIRSTRPLTVPFRRLNNSITALSKEAGIPKLVTGVRGVGAAARGVGREAWALGKQFAAIGAVAGLALFGIVKGSIDVGDELATVADRLGLSVDTYASLQFAAEQADVSQEQLVSSMDQLNKRMGDLKAGGGSLASFLGKVSPALLAQVKGAKSNEEAFGLLADAMVKLEDPNKRAALATAAFGKSGQVMASFLRQGRVEINKQQSAFIRLAGSQEAFARGAGELDNAARETQTAFLGIRNVAMGELFPAFTELSKGVTGFLVQNREGIQSWAKTAGAAISAWVKGGGLQRLADSLAQIAATTARVVDALGGLKGIAIGVGAIMGGKLLVSVASLAGSLWNLGAAVLPVFIRGAKLLWPLLMKLGGVVLPFLGKALVAVGAALVKVGVALLTTPVGWFIGAVALIAGAAFLIYKNWDPIVVYFSRLWADVKFLVTDNWAPIRDFFSELWTDITGFFTAAWAKIKPIVDGVMAVAQFSPIGLAVKGAGAVANWVQGGDTRPSLGAAAAVPQSAPARSTEARVVVDFANMPRGTRVTKDPASDAPLDLSMGYSMVTPG